MIRAKGFTIVELLIVIVVIGILAAITIVAFNGVQQRARHTATMSAVSSWERVVTAHIAALGPASIPSTNFICVGREYTAGAPVPRPGDGCHTQTSEQRSRMHAVNAALRTEFGALPSGLYPPTDTIVAGVRNHIELAHGIATSGPHAGKYYTELSYAVNNNTCGNPPAYFDDSQDGAGICHRPVYIGN